MHVFDVVPSSRRVLAAGTSRTRQGVWIVGAKDSVGSLPNCLHTVLYSAHAGP